MSPLALESLERLSLLSEDEALALESLAWLASLLASDEEDQSLPLGEPPDPAEE